MLGDALLRVRDLRKAFPVEGGRRLVAVDGVDLELAAGETLALVGESGSGKSTVARCIVRLVEPSGGDVVMRGESILGLQPSLLAGVYRRIQMVFQDPNASLNPRMSVRQLLEEPLKLHLYLLRSERAATHAHAETRAWTRLHRITSASLILWLLTTLAGAALPNFG